jgi:hypothetical protein
MLSATYLKILCAVSLAAPVSAQLIATDHFLFNPADLGNPNGALGEYVALSPTNQFRRNNAAGAGQNPTVAGFTGAWTGNVTTGTSQAVAQWTVEIDPVPSPQTAGYRAGARARFGGAAATNTLQRRVQRTLSPFAASNTYYFSLSSQVLTGDAADTVPGFVGVGFTSAGVDADFAAGSTMKGLLIGAANDGPNTDYVVRHVGSSGSLQMDVIQDNIVQGDAVTTVFDRFTIVRLDFNDEPANPAGNSKLTVWHNPSSLAVYSEAAATAAAAPIVLRTFALGTNADMVQMTMMGVNWSRAASFDEPRLAASWDDVVIPPNKTWVSDADGGLWNTPANWARLDVPNGVGANAAFIQTISAPRTVTVDAPTTVGSMLFSSGFAYTVDGSQTLTFSGSSTSMGVSVGSHVISAPVVIASGFSGTVSAGAAMAMGSVTVNSGVTASLNGDGSFSAATLLNNGAVTVRGTMAQLGLVGGTGSLRVAAGGLLNVSAATAAGALISQGALTVEGKLSVGSHEPLSGAVVVSVGALVIDAAGILELGNNDLMVNYAESSPLAGLIAAYTEGRLTVNGDAGGLPTYLALAEAADLGLTEFGGLAVDETTMVGKFTYVGDANLDGQVDALDYERVDLAIGNSGVFGTAQGDLNYDGNVDALDYEQIDLNIGNGVGSPLATVLVPEPTWMGSLAVLGLLAGRRRR